MFSTEHTAEALPVWIFLPSRETLFHPISRELVCRKYERRADDTLARQLVKAYVGTEMAMFIENFEPDHRLLDYQYAPEPYWYQFHNTSWIIIWHRSFPHPCAVYECDNPSVNRLQCSKHILDHIINTCAEVDVLTSTISFDEKNCSNVWTIPRHYLKGKPLGFGL